MCYTGECTPIKLLDSGHTTKHLLHCFVLFFVSLHNTDNTTGHHCITHSNTDTHIACECHLHLAPHPNHNIPMQPILHMLVSRLSSLLATDDSLGMGLDGYLGPLWHHAVMAVLGHVTRTC